MSFESLGAVSYSLSIVTMTISGHRFVRHLASKSGVTLKTGLGFVQGHWKWHNLIDRLPYYLWCYLVSSARYSDLLVENREIFTPNLYLSPVMG